MEQREMMQDSTRLHLPRWDELPDISLYMDQVLSLINPHFQDTYGDSYLLTSTMVNNYVKLGVVPSPVKRRYGKESISRLFVIVTLKSIFNVQEIAELISAIDDDNSLGYEISESYDLYCSTLEAAIASTYEDSISHTKPEQDYFRVIEDVATAAAYQLIVKRRLKLRRERKEESMIYKPEGVCAQLLNLDIEDGIVKSVEFIGGCAGNAQGLASLVKGMSVDDVIERLEGIKCGFKDTSCPDQLSEALKQYKNEQQ